MSTKNEIKQSQVIKRVLVELKTYRLQIVLSLICAVLTVIFTLLVPVLTGKAVDCMIGSGQIQWDGLYQILEKMALAIVGTCFFQWLMNRINNYITYDITKNMRQKAFEKMLVMPIKNIDSHSHGDYMSRIATDADGLFRGLLWDLPSCLRCTDHSGNDLFYGACQPADRIGSYVPDSGIPSGAKFVRKQDLCYVPVAGEAPRRTDCICR